MKLALGTVQFGMDYGVANRGGRVPPAEVERILAVARDTGIDTLDTAIAYGASEQTLGEVGVKEFKIVSKLPPLPEGEEDIAGLVERNVTASLKRLGISQLHAMLLHRTADLSGARGEKVYRALQDCISAGLVGKIGISIYAPDELAGEISDYSLGLVQSPFNAFDTRLADSGLLRKLKQAGTEVHTRSAFLQGLLLMTSQSRPKKFDNWAATWAAWQDWLAAKKLSPLAGALACVLAEKSIDRIVVGVDSKPQLDEIIAAVHSTNEQLNAPDFGVQKTDLINPSAWGRL